MPSAAAERKIPSDGYYFDDGEDGYIVYEVADEAVGDGEKAVAILNGNIAGSVRRCIAQSMPRVRAKPVSCSSTFVSAV